MGVKSLRLDMGFATCTISVGEKQVIQEQLLPGLERDALWKAAQNHTAALDFVIPTGPGSNQVGKYPLVKLGGITKKSPFVLEDFVAVPRTYWVFAQSTIPD